MEANLVETEQPSVILQKHGSGFEMGKIQRVAIAAIALETYEPKAIASLTGIDQKEVAQVLQELLANGWDTMETLEEYQLDERVNMSSNDNHYAILNKKGVLA